MGIIDAIVFVLFVLGVIGTGQVYHQLYRPALARCPEFSIVATADPAAVPTVAILSHEFMETWQ